MADCPRGNASVRRITVTSKALSPRAPRCCPDLRIDQAYEWKGDGFTRVRMEQTPQ